MNIKPAIFFVAAALAASGCALTSKSDVIVSRYFSPEASRCPARRVTKGGANGELRLGRIRAGTHLEERIVFRRSSHELGFYEDRRWTESPEAYLRRSLACELFEERGLRHVVSGQAPTLEVELSAFEEIRSVPRVARVRVTVTLHDERVARIKETIAFEQPVQQGTKAGEGDALADAMGQALAKAVTKVADRVVAELERVHTADGGPCADQRPEPSAGVRR